MLVYTFFLTLKVSTKNILTVESSRATATNFPFGLILTQSTLSSNFSVLVCSNDSTLALLSLVSSTISSNRQNLTVLSPAPVAQPRRSGVRHTDQSSVSWAGIDSRMSPAEMSRIRSRPSFSPTRT